MDQIQSKRIDSITITDHLEINLNPDPKKIDMVDGFFNGALCVVGVATKKPSLCIPFAKWFVSTAQEFVTYKP